MSSLNSFCIVISPFHTIFSYFPIGIMSRIASDLNTVVFTILRILMLTTITRWAAW